LEAYLKRYKAIDIGVLQQPVDSRQKSIAYANSLLGKPYDSMSAAKQALLGSNTQDESYNCGELVADALVHGNPVQFQDLQSKTFPSDFLFNRYLEPSYMTTIVS
jgi:uncharacterized protein YycO